MNILILEDDENSRHLMELLLKREGYKTTALGSVLQAFEHIRKGNIDLILMDVGLPGLDGISFTQKLKKYPAFSRIPIIAITGHPKEFLEAHALRSGCDAYLEKPLNTEALLKLVQQFNHTSAVEGRSPKGAKTKL